jgi:predicted Zn finger-like uncharacterized protein
MPIAVSSIGILQSAICNPFEAIMPLAKLTCPKCHAVLKPAKPVPEGKTVKCPKCEQTFKAGDKAAEEKAEEKKKPVAVSTKDATDDEDDGAGTYAVVKDEAEEKKKAEKEERERRKKKRRKRAQEEGLEYEDDEDEDEEEDVADQYLKNLKQRDPRGPAQETIVGPANWLLGTALLGFFGWVFYFGAFMLPVAFPNIEKKEEASRTFNADDKGKEKKKEKQQAIHWWSAESILNEENTPWSVLLFVFALLVGLAQAIAIGISSVKMQSMESYNWSLWGCIIAMIPMVTFPWFVFLTFLLDLFDFLLEAGMDETCWLMALVAFVWGPLVGGLCLKQFLSPQVKPGFEYKPE